MREDVRVVADLTALLRGTLFLSYVFLYRCCVLRNAPANLGIGLQRRDMKDRLTDKGDPSVMDPWASKGTPGGGSCADRLGMRLRTTNSNGAMPVDW